MEGKMKVCVLTGKQKLKWVERDIPQPGKGELQIKLEYVVLTFIFIRKGSLQTRRWTDRSPLAMNRAEWYPPSAKA